MKKSSFLFAALLSTLPLYAENKQIVIIHGITVDKVVKVISFEGDDVVLTYTDDSSDRADMEQVELAFSYDESSTAIRPVLSKEGEKCHRIYRLDGAALGESCQSIQSIKGLKSGVYVVNGKKVLIK